MLYHWIVAQLTSTIHCPGNSCEFGRPRAPCGNFASTRYYWLPNMTPAFPIAAAEVSPWLYALAGFVILYLLILRPLMKKRKEPADRAPAFSSLAQQRAAERDTQNVLVELSNMARQISGQLDTRAARLEALLQEADEKIARLQQLQQNVAAASTAPSIAAPPFAPDPKTVEDPRHAAVYQMADEGRSPQEIAQHLSRPRGEVELILALRR